VTEKREKGVRSIIHLWGGAEIKIMGGGTQDMEGGDHNCSGFSSGRERGAGVPLLENSPEREGKEKR